MVQRTIVLLCLLPVATVAFGTTGFTHAFRVRTVLCSTEDPAENDASSPAVEAPEPSSSLIEPVMRAENIEGSRRQGQDSFGDVSTQIFEKNPVLDLVPGLAGNNGFDPFSLATDKATLLSYRGAEIRHARLAMLAAVGWPVSELVQPKVAELLGMASDLTPKGLAPSVLNGGLSNVPPLFWVAALAGAAVLELRALDMEKGQKHLPGDLGFDPLGMGTPAMGDAELLNGRVAMLAITGFAIQEALYRLAVVNETPFFFHPPQF